MKTELSATTNEININALNSILTPHTCAVIINEIIKSLLFEKQQIPYPYNWLQSVVERKRRKNELNPDEKVSNFVVESHFKVASTAYDGITGVLKNLFREFGKNAESIREVSLIFGPSPMCPKEVFTFKINNLATQHVERNHANDIAKIQQKILRELFLSEIWMQHNLHSTLAPMNTFVFVKKHPTNVKNNDSEDEYFNATKPVQFSPKTKNLTINFNYNENECNTCCENLEIFNDTKETVSKNKNGAKIEGATGDDLKWYESITIKGFKNSYVNKTSVSDMW